MHDDELSTQTRSHNKATRKKTRFGTSVTESLPPRRRSGLAAPQFLLVPWAAMHWAHHARVGYALAAYRAERERPVLADLVADLVDVTGCARSTAYVVLQALRAGGYLRGDWAPTGKLEKERLTAALEGDRLSAIADDMGKGDPHRGQAVFRASWARARGRRGALKIDCAELREHGADAVQAAQQAQETARGRRNPGGRVAAEIGRSRRTVSRCRARLTTGDTIGHRREVRRRGPEAGAPRPVMRRSPRGLVRVPERTREQQRQRAQQAQRQAQVKRDVPDLDALLAQHVPSTHVRPTGPPQTP